MLASIGSESKRVASHTAASLVQSVLKERDKVVLRTGGNSSGKRHGLVEEIAQSAAAGIGTISEALHHRKEKRSRAPNPEKPSIQPGDFNNTESRPKQLDEGTGKSNATDLEGATPTSASPPAKDTGDIALAFIKRHPLDITRSSEDRQRLSLPVLVPQRRPEKRARGFIRAYAPMLANVDINQDTFLDFIDTFNKSLEPNPWISAVNLAGFAGQALPDPASLLFGFAVEAATEAFMEGQSLFCSNKFLNYVNAEFFIPRGLVCLVVTWQPDNDSGQFATNFVEEVDVPQTKPDLKQEISDIAAGKKKPSEGWQELKTEMGELMRPTHGDFSWPEPAPLIFPDFKGTPEIRDVEAKKKNVWDRMEDWINDHSDKRAQAIWIDENKHHPGMSLVPQPKFKSRYADPNHQVSSGDLVSMVTGGRWRLATDKNAESSKRLEETADETGEKEKGVQKRSEKDKKKQTRKDRKKGILEAEQEKKDERETEVSNRQERNQETIGPRSHTEEAGSAHDVEKDDATNTKDDWGTGENEDGRASGSGGKSRAKEAKKKAASSSKSGDIFKGPFQRVSMIVGDTSMESSLNADHTPKDVLYLAILDLPSQEKPTDDTVGPY
ncbi:hypothetical protein CFIO01_01334 [Colletotrichum fioriniae PJ7]|uniref:Uncharacterized protein n=1 Tax=Colletotrichum fioriniae PJ7 TaxID=1445577 RepID=A0A010RXL8_9PEZI|nr:hypothetical protein CFIO01_01334 [Colletotrichum fioriniae PJ7]